MRAYVLKRYGDRSAASLQECPIPQPAAGQIRVRVHAAGLNPVDYKTREGKLRAIYRYPLPQVLGNELAGEVDALGAGVSDFAIGQRVYARVLKEQLGAFAEYACVDAQVVAAMPASLDYPHAAGVPLAGLTALQCLRDELRVSAGMRLLITGGAGGVGCFAIPLAKWLGAEVTTTASSRGEALVRELGADAVIDYTRETANQQGRRFDAALDLVGGASLSQCFGAVRRGGQIVSIAGAPEPRTAWHDLDHNLPLSALFLLTGAPLLLRGLLAGVGYRYRFMRPDRAGLELLAGLIDEGKLPVRLDRVFPFAQIDAAFAHLEAGHAKGKVVVTMGEG